MKLALRRVASRPDGVAGVLLLRAPLGDLPLCVTLEDPWRNNVVGESCIPVGVYTCRKRLSPRFGATFEVGDVPGRSAILFHAGNTQADTRGCILLGNYFDGNPDNTLAIRESRIAFAAFLETLNVVGVEEFELKIEDCFGGSTALSH